MNDDPNRRLCDIHGLAAQIGRTESATWWMHRRGLLPPSRILGGRRVWRQSDVDEWLRGLFSDSDEIASGAAHEAGASA